MTPSSCATKISGLACKVFDTEQGKHQPTVAWLLATRRKQQRELAERRRLFYVAATRAQDYLLVCGLLEDNKPKQSWLAWLLNALAIEKLVSAGEKAVGAGRVNWRCPRCAHLSLKPTSCGSCYASQSGSVRIWRHRTTKRPPRCCAPCQHIRLARHSSCPLPAFQGTTNGQWRARAANQGQDRSSRELGELVHEMLHLRRLDPPLDAVSMRQQLREAPSGPRGCATRQRLRHL